MRESQAKQVALRECVCQGPDLRRHPTIIDEIGAQLADTLLHKHYPEIVARAETGEKKLMPDMQKVYHAWLAQRATQDILPDTPTAHADFRSEMVGPIRSIMCTATEEWKNLLETLPELRHKRTYPIACWLIQNNELQHSLRLKYALTMPEAEQMDMINRETEALDKLLCGLVLKFLVDLSYSDLDMNT